jgi:hypothetical protein
MLRTSFLLREVLGQQPARSSALPGYPKDVDPARSYWIKFEKAKLVSQALVTTNAAGAAHVPTTPFKYVRKLHGDQDKNSIRLLKVLKGSNAEPIHCELQYVSLNDDLDFEAISYCWGGQHASVEIRCDGRLLHITENLHSALQNFRRSDTSVLVWADAVCINQNDIDEKNIQVPLMRKIYEKASIVQIWLGKDTTKQDCKQAFQLLGKFKELGTTMGWDFDFLKFVRARKPPQYGLPDITDQVWLSLAFLVDRPWFGRAWIIQEVVVARDARLHCGSSSITWSDFCTGFLFGLNTNFRVYRPDVLDDALAYEQLIQIILTYKHFVRRASNKSDLATLLESHRATGAKDPRDKVYALLGLAHAASDHHGGVVPDYHMPIDQVYIDAAKAILELDTTLDMLGVPRITSESTIGTLPSWVPDWSTGDFASSFCFKNYQGQQCLDFDAAMVLTVPRHLLIVDKSIELSGYVFDRVSQVGPLLDPLCGQHISGHITNRARSSVIDNWMTMFPYWQKMSDCNNGRIYPTGEDAFDAYLQTLFLGTFDNGYSFAEARENLTHMKLTKSAKIYLKLYGSFARRVLSWLDSHLPPRIWISFYERPQEPFDATTLFSDMLSCSMHRRMVLTDKGYIGLAPRLTEEGDCIALVKGGRVPLVFRSRCADTWERIGDCYVHGIMHGEVFEAGRCEKMIII